MKERGKFFVFEGVGGSGKTSQLNLAGEFLNASGHQTIITREPGGIEQAEQIRELIFKLRRGELINADHQLALFFAAREIWKQAIVVPNVDNGIHVVSDRSFPATGAYQGYGEGGDIKQIEKISKAVMGEYMPNAIILLNLSVETAMQRNSKNKDGDPFDDNDKDYFARIINGYSEMAQSNWAGVDWYVVDAEKSIEEVHSDIKEVLINVILA